VLRELYDVLNDKDKKAHEYLIITKNVSRVVVSNVSDEVVPVTIVQPGVNVMKLYLLRNRQYHLWPVL
jgi:hypothetical protein